MRMDKVTEAVNPAARGLHNKSIAEVLDLLVGEEAQVAAAMREALPSLERAVELYVRAYRGGGRIVYVGAGTSGRLATVDAAECPPTFGTDPERIRAFIAGGEAALTRSIEGAEDDRPAGRKLIHQEKIGPQDLLIGLSASGEAPFVLGAVEAATGAGAPTVGITCNRLTTLAALVDVAIEVILGPEVVSGSTRLKAGTAEKIVLNLLSTTAMVQLGKVYDGYMVDFQVSNQKLLRRAQRVLRELTEANEETITAALAASDNHVKTAALMLLKNLDVEKARALLQQCEGKLHLALNIK